MTAGAAISCDVAPARVDESGAYATLHGQCFGTGWRADEFSAYAADPDCVVLGAHIEARLAGLIVCRSVSDEAEIITLAVETQLRRRGLARALWRGARERLARMGAARVFLEVGANNEAARGLYGTLGFDEVGLRQAYYRHGDEDALIMAMTISD